MVITVNGVVVKMTYLKCQEGGHILQLLVAGSSDGVSEVHKEITLLFERVFPGVMDKTEVIDGNSEIRLLERMMLEAIDSMRAAGMGVKEMVPQDR